MSLPDANVEAYRRSVLDALGADDPAEVGEGEAAAWRRLIADAGDDLATRPSNGEWSVIELLAHLADAELVVSTRYRWALAEDAPALAGYDQDAWVTRLHGADADPEALLELFSVLRRANVALWRASPAAARERVGVHAERGPESFDLQFRMQAGHGRVHRAQAQRALAEVRRR